MYLKRHPIDSRDKAETPYFIHFRIALMLTRFSPPGSSVSSFQAQTSWSPPGGVEMNESHLSVSASEP